jgi:hypothetical protein
LNEDFGRAEIGGNPGERKTYFLGDNAEAALLLTDRRDKPEEINQEQRGSL